MHGHVAHARGVTSRVLRLPEDSQRPHLTHRSQVGSLCSLAVSVPFESHTIKSLKRAKALRDMPLTTRLRDVG